MRPPSDWHWLSRAFTARVSPLKNSDPIPKALFRPVLNFLQVIFLEIGLAICMPKELFGTDGIRGIPGTAPLDDATLYATGRSLVAYLHPENPNPPLLPRIHTRQPLPPI